MQHKRKLNWHLLTMGTAINQLGWIEWRHPMQDNTTRITPMQLTKPLEQMKTEPPMLTRGWLMMDLELVLRTRMKLDNCTVSPNDAIDGKPYKSMNRRTIRGSEQETEMAKNPSLDENEQWWVASIQFPLKSSEWLNVYEILEWNNKYKYVYEINTNGDDRRVIIRSGKTRHRTQLTLQKTCQRNWVNLCKKWSSWLTFCQQLPRPLMGQWTYDVSNAKRISCFPEVKNQRI